MRIFLDRLYLFAGYAAGAFLVVIFLIMLGMSAGRQVGLNIPAGDDFTSWCMAAMSFLGLAHTFKKGEMIRVGILLEYLTGKKRWAVEIFSLTVATAFTVYFAWYAVSMTYDSYRFNDMAQGVVAVPLWIPQISMALGCIGFALAFGHALVERLHGGSFIGVAGDAAHVE
jgi:TRAP-type C4-dicarboxylate transport system permease small subunit